MSENRREYQKAIDYLSDQIRAGTLTVGSRLPTERAIAEALGISRNSTREALRTMENMGMIESKQGSGHYLTGSISNSLSGMIRMMLLLNRTSQKEMRRSAVVGEVHLSVRRRPDRVPGVAVGSGTAAEPGGRGH